MDNNNNAHNNIKYVFVNLVRRERFTITIALKAATAAAAAAARMAVSAFFKFP